MADRKESITELVDQARRQAESLSYIADANDALSDSQIQSLCWGADLLKRMANALDTVYIKRDNHAP